MNADKNIVVEKRKAAFFDRDGTLIDHVEYLSSLDQIKIIPGVFDFCRQFIDAGYLLFVISNQSGVARGFFDEAFVETTHKHLSKIFDDHGVHIEQFYFCPHHPDFSDNCPGGICECRKPEPGMILQAAKDHNIDLSQSFMFGDKKIDVEAGQAAGCKSFDIVEILELYKKNPKQLPWDL